MDFDIYSLEECFRFMTFFLYISAETKVDHTWVEIKHLSHLGFQIQQNNQFKLKLCSRTTYNLARLYLIIC